MTIDLFTEQIDLHGWTVSARRVHTDSDVHADHWETHTADELVCCLSGAFRVFLRGDRTGADDPVAVTAGTATVIPRGRWHRLELDEPSEILAFTAVPGARLAKLGA